FSKQFKTILWKNWKIFRKKFSIFSISFELFFTFLIVATLSIKQEKGIPWYEFTEGTEATDIRDTLFIENDEGVNERYIGFVLPKNQNTTNIDGEAFVSEVMKNPIFQKEFRIYAKIYDTEHQLLDYVSKEGRAYFLCGIIFGDNYTDYTISISGKDIIDPKIEPLSDIVEAGKNNYKKLFIQIQYAIDNVIIQWKTNHKINGINVSFGVLSERPLEKPKIVKFDRLGPYLIFIIIGQIFHLSNHLMKEKEDKIKEGLVVVGANPYFLSFSWTLIYFPLSLILITMVLIFDPCQITSTINIVLYYLLLLCYIIAMYSIVIVLSNFVKKYKTMVVILCLFMSMMLTLPEEVYKLRLNGHLLIHRIFSAIFPFFGMSMAVEEIGHENDEERYINFSNMFKSEFGINFIFVIADAVFYFFIAIFMEYIRGKELRNFGFSKVQIRNSINQNKYYNDIQDDPIGLECYVEVKNIFKFYKFRKNSSLHADNNNKNDKNFGKFFAANNNISFKVYKGEIFGILGHNGAGKSTLIQNMVGLIHPDSGETYYGGRPLSKNKKEIYREFGICLQNNVIIDGFTVSDHFKLYSGIRGVNDSEENLKKWLKEIDLVEKKDYEVNKMSGGQKRKLCIGLALIGNPKYVFLDEPTTGLDPLSRRKIWNLLLKVKKDRVIFITTHYMDEADIITDRKLILNHGIIRCLGSSVYLKNHFQMKYNLEVETSSPKEVDTLIHRIIPSAQFYSKSMTMEVGNNKSDTINTSFNVPKTNYLPNKSQSISFASSSSFPEVYSTHNSEIRLIVDRPENYNFSMTDRDPTKYPDISCAVSFNNNINKNTYTWKLPIQSSALFSRLLKDMEHARGSILNNFSLNAPILEELFVNLENQMEAENYEKENIKNLSKIQITKPIGILRTALRLSRYRLLVYTRKMTYLIMGILVPFCLASFLFPVVKNKFNNIIFSNFESRELSYKIFPNQLWNYEIENGSINNQLISQVLDGSKVNYLSHQEMMKVNPLVTNPPYFVASFSCNITESGEYNLTIFNNRLIAHSLPATLNVLSNIILANNQVNERIHVHSKPITYFNEKEINDPKLFATFIFTLCVAFPLSFYGMNVVRERSQKLLKQLQLNGVSNKSYWISVLITDHIMFMITCILLGGAVILYKFTPLLKVSSLVMLLIFIYISAFGCLLLQYCFSFFFKDDSNAFIIFFIINVVPTYMIFIEAYNNNLMVDYEITDASITSYLGVLSFLFSIIFPNFGIIRTFRSMIHVGLEHDELHKGIGILNILNPKNQVLTCLLGEIISIGVYFYTLKSLIRKTYDPKKGVLNTPEKIDEQYMKELKEGDPDIYSEYRRVFNNPNIPIRMIKLAKEYDDMELMPDEVKKALKLNQPSKYGEFHMSDKGSRRIVMSVFDNVSIGVNQQECFGVLGPNGSGKTSLLNATSFSFPQTLGKIFYDGKDTIERRSNEITIGYCPQEDTLWNEYSLLEHIEMFLYIQGHSKKETERIAKRLISYCHLSEHKNKKPSELSGGTRRKLNILIALCCSSTKIIMDEPTAGMDPSTRRYVWDIIKSTLETNNSSIVMSTHSMEEAELICNRIAIMIKGKIRCIGSPEYLKMKFGNTYILDVHTNNIEKFHREVVIGKRLFGNSDYEREVKSFQCVKYEVQSKENIGRVFDIMEKCRDECLFNDYSYSLTSLEQVFLNFVKKYGENE
ncbi:hypothetical protein U3516DRAFT_837123, partial [Neocallimastix sp. 'constans']